jgi:fatty acid-binding protein DegV
VPIERVRGRENIEGRILALLDQRLTPRPKVVRFGVAHADAAGVAERVRAALVARFQPRECLVSLATGVLGTHVGPGAWGVFYQVEDDAPTPKRGPRQE